MTEPAGIDPAPETPPVSTPPPPSVEPPAPEPPRTLSGAGLRYGSDDNVPEWAVGKTADEILAMTQQLYTTVQQGTLPAAPATPPSPASPAPSQTPSVDPQLLYTDPAAYTQAVFDQARTIAREELASAAPNVTSPISTMAKEYARGHRPEVWSAYGPEIEAEMAKVNVNARANIETWKMAVDLVAGRHVDTIALKRAEELMAASGDTGSIASAGGITNPSPGSSLSPIAKLFSEKDPSVQGYIDDGLTAADVVTQAARMGKTEEAYAEMLKNRMTRRVGA